LEHEPDLQVNKISLIPGLRSQMGDWWYYITTMTFEEVKVWIKKVDEIHERQELKTWIQRELREDRLDQISDYLRSQKQHFFNSIVVGIYGGEPDWYPLHVEKNPAMPNIQLDEKAKTTFGFLYLTGNEQIFAIDGQHRVEGIKKALSKKISLASNQQCVIFVSHKQTNEGRARTRRLFTTLNKYAKPVSKGELVALSEDDSFAIVTRKLIDDYAHLNISFVLPSKTSNIPTNETSCLTTTLALYDLVRIISVPQGSREKRTLETGPPNQKRCEQIFNLSAEFWDHLRAYVRQIKEVTNSKPDDLLAGKFRRRDGGHILFRPAGMKAFAIAVRVLMNRGVTMSRAIFLLSRTTLDLSTTPWPGVLWNVLGGKILNKNGRLATNLFLYMAHQPLEPRTYNLVKEYRKALDDKRVMLHQIKRIKSSRNTRRGTEPGPRGTG